MPSRDIPPFFLLFWLARALVAVVRGVTEADVGQRVSIQGYSCGGILRFFGEHKSKHLPRCGVELDKPLGRNNGTVDGHKYFKCKEKHGILVAPGKVFVPDVDNRSSQPTITAPEQPAKVERGEGLRVLSVCLRGSRGGWQVWQV